MNSAAKNKAVELEMKRRLRAGQVPLGPASEGGPYNQGSKKNGGKSLDKLSADQCCKTNRRQDAPAG